MKALKVKEVPGAGLEPAQWLTRRARVPLSKIGYCVAGDSKDIEWYPGPDSNRHSG